MDFLKIAVDNNVNNFLPAGYETVNLSDSTDLAELAAIVVKDHNDAAINLIEKLQQNSGLDVPVIKISPKSDQLKTQTLIKKEIQQYQQRTVPGFLTDLIDFAKKSQSVLQRRDITTVNIMKSILLGWYLTAFSVQI